MPRPEHDPAAEFCPDDSVYAEACGRLRQIIDGKVGVRLSESHARELLHALNEDTGDGRDDVPEAPEYDPVRDHQPGVDREEY